MKHEIRPGIKQVRPKRKIQRHHQQPRINRNRQKRQQGIRIRNPQVNRLHPTRLTSLFPHHQSIHFCFHGSFVHTVRNDFDDVGAFEGDGWFGGGGGGGGGGVKVEVEKEDEGEDKDCPEEDYCGPEHVEGDPLEVDVGGETEENGGEGDGDECTSVEYCHGTKLFPITVEN